MASWSVDDWALDCPPAKILGVFPPDIPPCAFVVYEFYRFYVVLAVVLFPLTFGELFLKAEFSADIKALLCTPIITFEELPCLKLEGLFMDSWMRFGVPPIVVVLFLMRKGLSLLHILAAIFVKD